MEAGANRKVGRATVVVLVAICVTIVIGVVQRLRDDQDTWDPFDVPTASTEDCPLTVEQASEVLGQQVSVAGPPGVRWVRCSFEGVDSPVYLDLYDEGVGADELKSYSGGWSYGPATWRDPYRALGPGAVVQHLATSDHEGKGDAVLYSANATFALDGTVHTLEVGGLPSTEARQRALDQAAAAISP